MKRGTITLLLVGGVLILGIGSEAVTPENPYQSIVARNVFQLKPPPPPIDQTEAAKQAPPNIFLTGITTIFGNKRVLLKSAPVATKAGEKPVEQNYILTEGERDGDVEVLQIDERNGVVKIRLAGKEMDLDFDKNGVKIAAAPPPPPAATPGAPRPVLPGFPLRPAGAAAMPVLPTPAAQPATPFRSSSTMSREPRIQESGVMATSYGTVGNVNLGGYAVTSGTGTQQVASQQPTMTAEEQAVLIEVERERQRGRLTSGNGVIDPMPITQVTSRMTVQQPTSQGK